MPNISVIITTYNRAGFLSQAIEGVLEQTYDDYELIIIDDGSTDNTANVVGGYNDPRIHYHWQENQERSASRNRGVALSQGQYITFLDADDWYLPNKLACQATALDNNPGIGMVASGWSLVDENGNLIRHDYPWLRCSSPSPQDWLFGGLTLIGANLIRREWFTRVEGFDPDLSHHEDTHLWFRLVWAGCKTAWVKEPVMAQRIHPANTMHDAQRMRDGQLKMLSKIYELPDVELSLGLSRNKAYAKTYLGNSFRLYAVGQTEAAQADMSKAIQLMPVWLDNNAERIFQGMWAWANNPLIDDPKTFAETILTHLPKEFASIKWNKSRVMAGVWITKAFEAYWHSEMKTVRQALTKALTTYPGWVRNRGVISIALSATVGQLVR